MVCEKVGSGVTRVIHKQLLVERHDFQIEANETFAGTFSIPTNAQLSTKTVQTLVTWNIRLRRKLSGTGGYDTDYPFRVEGGRLPGDVD